MASGTRAAEIQDKSEATQDARRMDIERLIDEIVAQSFPASDPPAWGVISALFEEENDRLGRSVSPGTGSTNR